MRIVRLSKQDPFKGSKKIKKEVFGENNSQAVSARIIRRLLVQAGLFGKAKRKLPMSTLESKTLHLQESSNIGLSVNGKMYFSLMKLKSTGCVLTEQYVRPLANKELYPKYMRASRVKHCRGNVKERNTVLNYITTTMLLHHINKLIMNYCLCLLINLIIVVEEFNSSYLVKNICKDCLY